ncbi:MAG TPA: hypothetical protein PLJ88_00130, partial [Agitococcus sp.]|nr:hypothetical protein [Agitococcus sp.]
YAIYVLARYFYCYLFIVAQSQKIAICCGYWPVILHQNPNKMYNKKRGILPLYTFYFTQHLNI